jgi:hypothetical protein
MKNATLAKRVIYSLSGFSITLVSFLAWAQSLTGGNITFTGTWFLWIAFVLLQTWFQNRIWNEDDLGRAYLSSLFGRIQFKPVAVFAVGGVGLIVALLIALRWSNPSHSTSLESKAIVADSSVMFAPLGSMSRAKPIVGDSAAMFAPLSK